MMSEIPPGDPSLATEPLADPCSLCGRHLGVFRRGLCRSCYRKLSDCGLPLPCESRPGPEPFPSDELLEARLTRWLAQWPAVARERLALALAKVGTDP